MKNWYLTIYRIAIVVCFSALTGFSQVGFLGIIPAVSTRDDVEKALGKANAYGSYKIEEGTIHISYRETRCEHSAVNCLCFVPIGTVLEIVFYPKVEMKIEDLKLDPKEWKKNQVQDHAAGIEVYINSKTGVSHEVESSDGTLRNTTYSVPDEACRKLIATPSELSLTDAARCKQNLRQRRE